MSLHTRALLPGHERAQPILQKNLREVMEHFLWDWEEFVDQYKVVVTSDKTEA